MSESETARLMAAAIRHYQSGALTETASACRKLLAVDPDHVQALGLLGVVEGLAGQLDAAIRHLRRALELAPDNPGLHVNLGMAMVKVDRLEEGGGHYARAAELAPGNATIQYDYGCVLERQGRLDHAKACFRRAIELQPEYPGAYHNLGNVLRGKGMPEAALACFETALRQDQGMQEAYVNAGLVLLELGRYSEALRYNEHALTLNPADPEAHMNRAVWHFLHGNLETAWPEYEWRWETKDKLQRNFPFPAWDGASLAGKTLLVYAEQGIGDELMFASCVPDLVERAAHVVLECAPRLAPLFQRSFPAVTVHGGSQYDPVDWVGAAGPIDVQVACGSAPAYLRRNAAGFPGRRGYLVASMAARRAWRRRFSALGDGLKVGVSWRGGKGRVERLMRSIPLSHWTPVFAVPNVHFINLQYGDCGRELESLRQDFGYRIRDWPESDPLADLDDFAAQIAELDLVISIDNSTVHMAGALGVPVWTLLPYVPEWRWMLERSDTPWYPTMRLFRQTGRGVWDPVIREVADHLRAKASEPDLPQ